MKESHLTQINLTARELQLIIDALFIAAKEVGKITSDEMDKLRRELEND